VIENNKYVMRFSKWVTYVKESLKDVELNRILDKINKKDGLNDYEEEFLNRFSNLTDDDIKDYMYLSNIDTIRRISSMISNGDVVKCGILENLGDIISIDGNSILTKNKSLELKDNFLYNLIHKGGYWILFTQDEYFEKIPLRNDN